MPVQLKFTALFKCRLKGLAKRYRQIQTDVKPVLDQIIQGNFIGNQITGTHTPFTKSGPKTVMPKLVRAVAIV
ncbi:hypothetical protein [Microcoleus sp. Pol12A4]